MSNPTQIQNANLLFSGLAGSMFIQANTGNNIQVNGVGQIKVSSSGVPTLNVTNPNGTPSQSIIGNDFSGSVTFASGTNNLAGNVCSVTFATPKTTTPLVYINQQYCTAVTGGYNLMANSVTTGSFAVYCLIAAADNKTYTFNYTVLQNYI